MTRTYLDWNATAPLRPEARAAMIAAMDVVGNPSSVHGEGRAAKAIVEKARGQVAALAGCEPSEVVFTSGATEGAHSVVSSRNWDRFLMSDIEHDAVDQCIRKIDPNVIIVRASNNGSIGIDHVELHPQPVKGSDDKKYLWHKDESFPQHLTGANRLVAFQAANSETGVVHQLTRFCLHARTDVEFLCDMTQLAQWRGLGSREVIGGEHLGRETIEDLYFNNVYSFGVLSGHKMGSAKGVGAVIVRSSWDDVRFVAGGGQEMGRRSGTENVIGIAGFGAAAEIVKNDLGNGESEKVGMLRNKFEDMLQNEAPDIIVFGKDVARLPNTSNFAIPGWKGETQVMQMDLAGYAVSAGSACSSGKVKESRVLRAMGFDSVTASSAIRVSIGPTTTEDELMGFAQTWLDHYKRWKQRAA